MGIKDAPSPPKAQSSRILYYHTDHLGTPREMTNSNGNIAWAATYKAWGATQDIHYPPVLHIVQDGNTVQEQWIEQNRYERPTQNLRFQGQYYDQETGLHYNRFRYYDPDIGRFISQDPIGLFGGQNLYQYAPSPVTWIDPWGLAPKNYVDFSGQANVFYQVTGNQLNEVTIKMQGSRARDFAAANRLANIQGGTPRNYTWHHVNFDPNTGNAKMQLVSTDAHKSVRHRGSVADFQDHFGVKYGTPEAVKKAQETWLVCPCKK